MKGTFFDYFYGTQAEQFSFYRLPKILITDKRFRGISSDAKILYGVMLERMSLSVKNRWFDEKNRVYIIFTLEEVMETFACSERKAGRLLGELDTKTGIGLIEKKRQGLGKPNLIYLKNFIDLKGKEDAGYDENTEKNREHQNIPVQSGQIWPLCEMNGKNTETARSQQDPADSAESDGESLQEDGQVMQIQSGQIWQFWSRQNRQSQSCQNGQTNNTDKNYTDQNKRESILPSIIYQNGSQKLDEWKRMIRKKIEYDYLKADYRGESVKYLDELVEIIAETLCMLEGPVKIGNKIYPEEVVKERFQRLEGSHIRYVMDSMSKNTTKIHNMKSYLLAALLNAPMTIDHAYRAQANHDWAALE